MVSLYDEFGAFIANLGFTDNSGVIMFADFTLSPGGYWFQAGATGYMINRVSFLLVLVSQIFLTTVIVRYDHMEKYEAQLLIFAAQCCFIWYQIAMFESASRKK